MIGRHYISPFRHRFLSLRFPPWCNSEDENITTVDFSRLLDSFGDLQAPPPLSLFLEPPFPLVPFIRGTIPAPPVSFSAAWGALSWFSFPHDEHTFSFLCLSGYPRCDDVLLKGKRSFFREVTELLPGLGFGFRLKLKACWTRAFLPRPDPPPDIFPFSTVRTPPLLFPVARRPLRGVESFMGRNGVPLRRVFVFFSADSLSLSTNKDPHPPPNANYKEGLSPRIRRPSSENSSPPVASFLTFPHLLSSSILLSSFCVLT